jgi:hypothetical protein
MVGSADQTSISAIQKRLNQVGCGPVVEDGNFGAETLEAVERFQARSVDTQGLPLLVDGKAGPMTWAALFRTDTVPVETPGSALAGTVLKVAAGQIGVLEVPPGSNSGPDVNRYLAAVNTPSGNPWCAAFVYWCFDQAAKTLNTKNPAICTAGVLDMWNQAGARGIRRIASAEASNTPGMVQPGMVFVISTGGGHGHAGLVESVNGVVLTTIEGNTNEGGSREGIGVFRHQGRRIGQINCGFVDFG